jgi:hypothetical protein
MVYEIRPERSPGASAAVCAGRGPIGGLARQAERMQHGPDHPWIKDGRDKPQPAAARAADQYIHIEGPPHQLHPRPAPTGWERRGPARAGGVGRGGAGGRRRGLDRRRRPVAHHGGAPARVRSEDSVAKDQVDSRPRDEGGKARKKVQRFEDEVARAVRPRRLQLEHNAAVLGEPEPILRDGGPQQVAAELVQALAILPTPREAREVAGAGLRDHRCRPRRQMSRPTRGLIAQAEGGAAQLTHRGRTES